MADSFRKNRIFEENLDGNLVDTETRLLMGDGADGQDQLQTFYCPF